MTINGHVVTEGQAMTVRVAIEAMARDLVESGLGDDEHGKIMTEGYLARIDELRRMIADE
jgi:hypothetical protein